MTDEQSAAGKLSAEDQAEYNRLEALEQKRGGEKTDDTPGTDELSFGGSGLDADEHADQVEFEQTRDREPGESDPKAEVDYPVRNAALEWSDASNGGDTSRQAKAVYDTPWGRRELAHEEVVDLEHQGHALRLVDDEAQTSLSQEKAEMEHIRLTDDS